MGQCDRHHSTILTEHANRHLDILCPVHTRLTRKKMVCRFRSIPWDCILEYSLMRSVDFLLLSTILRRLLCSFFSRSLICAVGDGPSPYHTLLRIDDKHTGDWSCRPRTVRLLWCRSKCMYSSSLMTSHVQTRNETITRNMNITC